MNRRLIYFLFNTYLYYFIQEENIMIEEVRKPNNVVFNFEVIRDFCGSISKYERSHLDNEIWTRNLLLLKHFPDAFTNIVKSIKETQTSVLIIQSGSLFLEILSVCMIWT